MGGAGEKRTLPAAARWAQHWNFVAGPPEVFAHKRAVLVAACEEIGRDPSEITTSTQIFLGREQEPKEVAEQAAAFADVGCDLVVVGFAPPHTPAVLQPLAEAVQPLTGS